MTSPIESNKRIIIFSLFCLLFLLIIPFILLYSTGYRFRDDFEIQPTGGVYVYYPESGVTISVDGTTEQTTSVFEKSFFVQNLDPDVYTINVSKEGSATWTKNILVEERRVAEAYPFLAPLEVATSTIPENLKKEVIALFATTTPRVSDNRLSPVSSTTVAITQISNTSSATTTTLLPLGILNQNAYLYKEDKKITVLWQGSLSSIPFYFCNSEPLQCDLSLNVFDSIFPIKHVDFYPDRNDVIIYSTKEGLFATEFDKRSPQNNVKIFEGNVDFREREGLVYIKDNNKYYELVLK